MSQHPRTRPALQVIHERRLRELLRVSLSDAAELYYRTPWLYRAAWFDLIGHHSPTWRSSQPLTP